MTLVPVLRTKSLRSWPKHETATTVPYRSVPEVFTSLFDSDAHFACYSAPEKSHRLSVEAFSRADVFPNGVPMVLAVFDVDSALAHGGPHVASDDWWRTEVPKLEALEVEHPGAFVYRTRGGYRIVYLLDAIVIRDGDGLSRWKLRYCSWIAYLGRRFEIHADASCKDATRLFRLPFVRRDGVLQELETRGEPLSMGVWTCDLAPEDQRASGGGERVENRARREHTTPARAPATVGDGVLFNAFRARGDIGHAVEAGTWALRCPWTAEHTKGSLFDTSTVLFAPGPGEELGRGHCSHAHCSTRTMKDWLSVFTDDELQAARVAAGLPTTIVIGPAEHDINDSAVQAMGRLTDLYERGGKLVEVVNATGVGIIREIPLPRVRELLARAVRWESVRRDRKTESPVSVPAHPPDWCVRAVHARGSFPGIATLRGLTESPVMRPDGSILQRRGYDPATQLLYLPNGAFPPVPDAPTQADAMRALIRLLEPFEEFSFASEPHRYTPVATVLAGLARPAIVGSVPATEYSAAGPGEGKTLLMNVVHLIVTGRPSSPASYPAKEEELEKVLSSYGMRGDAFVTFDNVTSRFGGGPIDKVLTAVDTVDLRVLGRSEIVSVPWSAIICFTGNNPQICDDTQRRCIRAQLSSGVENPENRTDFKRPALLKWTADNRPALVVAGLTMLRAYVTAGRPDVGLKPWGSFEAWSALVASAIVYAGGEDPMKTRLVFEDTRPGERGELDALLEGWAKLQGEAGLTCGAAIRTLEEASRPPELEALLETDVLASFRETVAAVASVRGRLDAKRLGEYLAKHARRTIGGRRFVRGTDLHKVARWKVESVLEMGDLGELGVIPDPARGPE